MASQNRLPEEAGVVLPLKDFRMGQTNTCQERHMQLIVAWGRAMEELTLQGSFQSCFLLLKNIMLFPPIPPSSFSFPVLASSFPLSPATLLKITFLLPLSLFYAYVGNALRKRRFCGWTRLISSMEKDRTTSYHPQPCTVVTERKFLLQD